MPIFSLETNEFQLLHTFKYESLLLPINITLEEEAKNFFCYFIDSYCAALFEISEVNINPEGYLYTLQVIHITEANERVRFIIPTKESTAAPIPFNDEEEYLFLEKVKSSPNSLRYFFSNIEDLYETESNKKEKMLKKKANPPSLSSSNKIDYKNINEPHLRAQFLLKELGNLLDYDTFIAKNDQHRFFRNNQLSDNTLKSFPSHNIPGSLTNHFSLIDTMWFSNGTPSALFEVEMTTSVYSGILRMADLICTIENPTIQLYIVTERSRERKVRKELERPVFQRIGLTNFCKIIFLEDLETLYNVVSFIPGYVKSNVLDKISC